MFKPMVNSALVVALLLSSTLQALGAEAKPDPKAQEAKLLAVLKAGGTRQQKADACRQLAVIGTKDAVPVLAALLGDKELAHMARYALEPIPDPAVDDAFRAALGRVKGLPLVGVIGSIGVRRDAKATDALVKLLTDPDAHVAQGAARALGSIGTPAAADALEAALAKTTKANQLYFCEGVFRCAEAMAAGDQSEKAKAIYDRLRTMKQAPHQVRTGALRGAVLTRGKAGIPMLVEAIRGKDLVLTEAAMRTATEMPGPEVAKALADELAKLPAGKQILLTQTLGKLHEAGAMPALVALAKKGDTAARIAAIRAIGEIGEVTAAPVLVALFGDADVAQAARDALAGLEGKRIDEAIGAMLKDKDPATRAVAVELLVERHMVGAVPALLEAASDPDETLRIASLKALGSLATAKEFPLLVGLLVKAKSAGEIRTVERALSSLCSRDAQPVPGSVVVHKAVYGALPKGPSADVTKKVAAMVKRGVTAVEASNTNFGDPANGTVKSLRIEFTANGVHQTKTVRESDSITLMAGVTPPAYVDALCAALPKAPTKPKLALLNVLRSAGGAKSLAAIRTAATDADADVQSAAISVLCNWPTADALPDVQKLAKAGKTPREKILGLRGTIRLIPLQDASDDEKLAGLKDAMGMAQRTEEKKLGLASLGAIASAGSLALVVPHLDNAAVREEACLAAVAISEKIARRHRTEVTAAMEKVLEVTKNKQTRAAAQRIHRLAKR